MGTGLAFIFASAIYRLPAYPPVLGSLAMLVGYFESMLKGVPRYGDAAFRAFLRRYQFESLLLGKARAARRAEQRQAHAWRGDAAPGFEIPPDPSDVPHSPAGQPATAR